MSSASESASLAKARRLLGDFGTALGRLSEALAQPETEFIRDASIQRFEFYFELAWKALQAVARYEGADCSSPRAAFSLAWQGGWVTNEAAWLDMLDDRNRTSHTYREALAREVFARLPGHLASLEELKRTLVARTGTT